MIAIINGTIVTGTPEEIKTLIDLQNSQIVATNTTNSSLKDIGTIRVEEKQ